MRMGATEGTNQPVEYKPCANFLAKSGLENINVHVDTKMHHVFKILKHQPGGDGARL